MLSADARFAINHPDVVGESLDGEAVVVNLSTGTYYSLPGTAAIIWELVLLGHTATDIAARLHQTFDCDGFDVTAETGRFLEELVRAELVMGSDAAPPEPLEQVVLLEAKPAFESPVLEVHSDLADILMLDPIHEVDEQGWPMAGDSRQQQR